MAQNGGKLDHAVGEAIERVCDARLEVAERLDRGCKVVVVLGKV